jgi:hypothetical protein
VVYSGTAGSTDLTPHDSIEIVFNISDGVVSKLEGLLLAAAEKGWEVLVAYNSYEFEGSKHGDVYRISVEDFRSR